MIVILKHNVPQEKKEQLIAWLRKMGLTIHVSDGEGTGKGQICFHDDASCIDFVGYSVSR